MRSLTKLRQLSLDPALIDEEHDGVGSAKIDVLLEHLQEVTAEGHRALVFSQFTSYLAAGRERGSTTPASPTPTSTAARAIARLLSSRSRRARRTVFLISLKAGGVGLNLVEADYCYRP